MFIENVFSEVEGKQVILAGDFDASRILERLLLVSNDHQTALFASKLLGSYDLIVRNQFGSHVFQTLLNSIANMIDAEMKGFPPSLSNNNNQDSSDLDTLQENTPPLKVQDIVALIVKELDGKWASYMTHIHGTFCIRSLLNLLSGSHQQARSKKSINYNMNHNTGTKLSSKGNIGRNLLTEKGTQKLVPVSFYQLLQTLTNSLLQDASPEIHRLSRDTTANPVLQLLVTIPQSSSKTIHAIMNQDASKDHVKDLIKDRIGSHLMEKIIQSCTKSEFKTIYKTFFREDLIELSSHPFANFVVQAIIHKVPRESYFTELVDKIEPKVEEFLFKGAKSGIIVKLVDAGRQYPSSHARIVEALLSAFHATDNDSKKNIANLVLNLRTNEVRVCR